VDTLLLETNGMFIFRGDTGIDPVGQRIDYPIEKCGTPEELQAFAFDGR
jgi:hypothetical protein